MKSSGNEINIHSWLFFMCFNILVVCYRECNAMDSNEEEYVKPIEKRSWFGGRYFANPWDTWRFPSAGAFLETSWGFFRKQSPSKHEIRNNLPVITPTEAQLENPAQGLKVTWLGHASCLVQLEGVNILTDPITSERCSFSNYIGPKRYTRSPLEVSDLPNIDSVVISHSHYDHLDLATVKQLHARFKDTLRWFVPMGLKQWFTDLQINNVTGPKRYTRSPLEVSYLPNIDSVVISHSYYDHLDLATVKQLHARFKDTLRWFVPMGLKQWFTDLQINNVTEMTWWEENNISENVKIASLPAQHWSNRFIHDRFVTLWGGWAILGKKSRFYFAGDTGYCTAFKEIGEKYGPFTASAIPIGAYCPRKMMQAQHVDPEEAVKIHQDVRSLKSIGIHWGTFDLSLEPILEPKEKLKECSEAAGLKPDEFTTIQIGETLHLNSSHNHEHGDSEEL